MKRLATALLVSATFAFSAQADEIRATGDLGLVVERETGSSS